jgi:hypothetical protein
VLLICGSGPHDLDESLQGHRPFLVLADYLTRKGIADSRERKIHLAINLGPHRIRQDREALAHAARRGFERAGPNKFQKVGEVGRGKPEEQVLLEEANEQVTVHETGRVSKHLLVHDPGIARNQHLEKGYQLR